MTITDADDPEDLRYDHGWELDGAFLKAAAAVVDRPLLPGANYKVRVAMSEYTNWPQVRLRDGPALPVVDAADYTDTRTSEYTAALQVPFYNEDQLVPLLINDTDYAGNQLLALELDRKSIDPSRELTRGADGVMQGAPGEDGSQYLRVEAAPPVIGYNKTPLHYNGFNYSCQGDVPERCGSEADPINIPFSSVPFLYADIGSGIKELYIYKERLGGERLDKIPARYNEGLYAMEPLNSQLGLKDGKYVQVVIDNLGRGTII